MSPDRPIVIEPIRTERMMLRPLREIDLAAFVRYQKTSWEHLRPWSPRMAEGETPDAFFARQLERSERERGAGTSLRLAAFDAAGGEDEIVGMFNLNNIVRGAFECADAGWQVAAGRIGQGLATEGVLALLDVAFALPANVNAQLHEWQKGNGLGLHRVQANVIPTNAASLRVAAKCGFRREGLAMRMVRINGEWRDHVMHAKLADEHATRPES